MKTTTLALGILSAVLLVPTAAFAHDKRKDKYCDDAQARIEADRRANGYYDARPYCPPARVYDNCQPEYRPRYYVPDCDRRDYLPSGFYIRIP
jgi:hypothetical protein